MSVPITEGEVYLALKDDFSGERAKIRQNKTIRKVIKDYRARDNVQDTLQGYNETVILNTAKKLLNAGVFESTDIARALFPEFFEDPASQIPEDIILEQDNSQDNRQENSQPSNGVPTIPSENMDSGEVRRDDSASSTIAATLASNENTAIRKASDASSVVPSLFPVYLPFKTQHEVLVFLQKLLESSCYDFAARTMPHMLSDHGWDCAEAVELNVWTLLFMKEGTKFQKHGSKLPAHLFASITSIRHAAVHRERVDGQRVVKLVSDAEAFTKLLGDAARTEVIAGIRNQMSGSLEDLRQYKESLHSRHERTLQEIAAKRKELDLLEKEAVAQMLADDQKRLALAGQAIEEMVGPPDPSFVDAMEVMGDSVPELQVNGEMVKGDEDEDEDEGIEGLEQAEGVAIDSPDCD